MAKHNGTEILGEAFPLTNGATMPKLGYGTWLIPTAQAAQCTTDAISIGYRLIDTAQAYGNEKQVGEGIRASGVPREELFVVSKVAAELKEYDAVAASIDRSYQLLGIGALDMMLIHSPQPWAQVNKSSDRFFEGNRQAWKALEDAVEAGKVKGIGVANFLEEDLENILSSCEIAPAVNQVLCHAGNTPLHLINWCHEKRIRVMAYSPLGHGAVIDDPVVTRMAEKYEVTPAQLLIRYDVQLGVVPVVKASTSEHMRDDAMVHFAISKEDEKELRHWKFTSGYGAAGKFPVFGG